MIIYEFNYNNTEAWKNYGTFQEKYNEVGWTNKISTYEKNKEENTELNKCFFICSNGI